MIDLIHIALLVGIIFGINLPFGYWRADTKKMSTQWVLAIHLPVPFIFLARYALGAGWQLLPFSVAAFFFGQLIGGKIRVLMSRRIEPSACLVLDLWSLTERPLSKS